MASENAKRVVREIEEKTRKGEKINMQEIQMNNGYSKSSAKSMNVKRTKTFQEGMKTVVQQLEKERQRVIKASESRDLNTVEYKDLMKAMDTLTKNIQLLSGEATENINVKDYSNYSSDELRKLAAESESGTSEEGVIEETPA